MSTLVALLFGVWVVGIVLSIVIPTARPLTPERRTPSHNFKLQTSNLKHPVSSLKLLTSSLHYFLPSLIALYLSIDIAWLSNQTGLSSIGWSWFTIGSTNINLTFEFNKLTAPLLVIVSAISCLVHVYSIAYMKHDAARPRFFATLGLFTFSMLGLTLSGNLLQLFMFWELVGVSSYLLIGFYRDKPEASQAATKAMLINKIGDVGFLIALMMLWAMAGTLDIENLTTNTLSIEWRTFIGTAILIAVLAKSAQFPFHSWLPDAMAGPTPVSALIHSATMVAAGVFLLARLNFLFTPLTLQITAILGGITALIGGLNAIRENDLKRFLAWSTLSQLGLMVMVAGGNAFDASFMHLLSHAIFKAGLFLAVGISIQHYHVKALHESSAFTTTFRVLVIVLTLALMGMPLTIGFFSKEFMLGSVQSPVIAWSISALSFITAFYSARLIMFIRPTGKSENLKPIPRLMLWSVAILAVASFWIFYSWSPLSARSIANIFQITEPVLTMAVFSIALIFLGLASGIGFIKQGKLVIIQKLIPSIPYDSWLRFLFAKPVLALSEFSSQADSQIDKGIHLVVYLKVSVAHLTAWFDQNIIDGIVHGLAWISKALGNIFRKLVTGRIQDYIWWTVMMLILILIVILN